MKRTFQTETKRFTIEAEVSTARPCAPYLSVDLEPVEGEATTLSISGTVQERTDGGLWRDCGGGQIVDEFRAAFPWNRHHPDDCDVQRLCDIWDRHHLGSLNAGSQEQKAILNAYFERVGKPYDYGTAYKVLELEGKLDVPIPGQLVYKYSLPEFDSMKHWPLRQTHFMDMDKDLEGKLFATRKEAEKQIRAELRKLARADDLRVMYDSDKTINRLKLNFQEQPKVYRYGSAWLCEHLPEDIVTEVRAIMERGDTTEPETLAETLRVTIDCQKTDTNPHIKGQDMDHWRCVLRRPGHQLTTVFSMGSGHNGHEPTADQVLECLLSDAGTVQYAGGFREWADTLGFEHDSRKAEQTFKTTQRQTAKLERFLGDSYAAALETA